MSEPVQPPRTATEVGVLIGKSPNWMKRNAARLPHHKFGRSYVFTEDDVAEILRLAEFRPEPSEVADPLRPVGAQRRRSA